MEKVYKISVDCANCANKAEKVANKVCGVKSVTVNFMALKMAVEFEEGADEKAVIDEIIKVCKKVEKDFEIFI